MIACAARLSARLNPVQAIRSRRHSRQMTIAFEQRGRSQCGVAITTERRVYKQHDPTEADWVTS